MSEPNEENPTTTVNKEVSLMDFDFDFDFDLDSSWAFNQNRFFSSLSSPFLINSPELPFSPLYNLSDGGDVCGSPMSSSGGLCLADSPSFISCSNESVTPNVVRNGDKRGCLLPTIGLVPMGSPDLPCMIKERMRKALKYFKESTEQTVPGLLAQVWAPVKIGDRYVLTTSGQPFVLDTNSNGLLQYRVVSLMYIFSADGESDGDLGLPGRVFRQKLPEWTPNVQYYSKSEYPLLDHALHYNVHGTLALPVFESSSQSCVGVLEIITTYQKVIYAPEIDKVCKALEAVNLKSSEKLDINPNLQICNEGRQHALAEILEILNAVCELYKLPLAQTWVPCRHRSVLANGGGVKSCSSFDGSCVGQVCMSTTDVAFYVVDAHMWGFRDACSEHHLQKGQGVAGRAFASHSSCFSRDITQFSKSEYPLVHYALMFGLMSCYAICLRSSYTGSDDYILEFFLPPSITDDSEQQDFLASLLATMKEHFRSLRIVSEQDMKAQNASVQIVEIPEEEVMQESLMKTSERRCGKSGKSISLEVLQQYFAGSLKDAAKSLSISPATLRRICRQHGVSRWPSQKINKVNHIHSISKQKRVTESVKDGEATLIYLTSFATSSLSVAVGPVSWPVCLDGPKEQQLHFRGQKEMQSPNQMILQSSEVLDNINPNLQVVESEELPKDVWDNEIDDNNSVTFPIRVGDTFASAKEFRDSLASALIQVKKEVDFKKSEKKRIVAKCSSQGCKWRIYAGGEQDSENIAVKTMSDTHTCQRLNDSTNKLATSIWVSNRIIDKIRQHPELQAKGIQAFIKSAYQVDIDYMTAYRARERVSKKIYTYVVD